MRLKTLEKLFKLKWNENGDSNYLLVHILYQVHTTYFCQQFV
jgi:hypothetical protein